MNESGKSDTSSVIPPLAQLGPELVRITGRQQWTAIALPLLCSGAYFLFAILGWWTPAVLAIVALSFFTYGSTSHDLVHRSLGLPRAGDDILLCLIELLALRSGHAYRAAHLHHHAHYPHPDDVESSASRKTWLGALTEGPTFSLRIWWWAHRHARNGRGWIFTEGVACVALLVLAVAACPITPIPLVYVALVVLGAWPIPLMTSFVPHDPAGKGELLQTRAFRGVVASALALEHLYHLEHHLYPAVPHQNWPKLARRLDPYLKKAGVKSIKIWF